MRSPLEGWKGAPTAAHGLNPNSLENRRLLCYLMHSTGLSNCRDEFWHWSYGDSAWAVRSGKTVACYGLIAPPDEANRVIGGKLVLSPYDPSWADQFEEIRHSLLAIIGDLTRRIEHVGSTAIPGLSADTILDIDIVLESREQMTRLIELMNSAGYECQDDLGIEGGLAFKFRQGDEWKDAACRSLHAHRLHAYPKESTVLLRHLAFRDHLCQNSAAAAKYSHLKQKLAQRHPWDRTRYLRLREPLILEILRELKPSLAEHRSS